MYVQLYIGAILYMCNCVCLYIEPAIMQVNAPSSGARSEASSLAACSSEAEPQLGFTCGLFSFINHTSFRIEGPCSNAQVNAPSSGARSEASSLAAFGSEADFPARDTTAAPPQLATVTAGVSSEIALAEDQGPHMRAPEAAAASAAAPGGANSCKWRNLTPQLVAAAGSGGSNGGWLPDNPTSLDGWRDWLRRNRMSIGYYGFGAATAAAVGVYLLSGSRRRQ